ncbi:hypothetical protein PIB30_067728 [Stylosanthes scabra]|uniref:Aminotransferase-like plant mobile domain-containing protein n=1 Tax=Stylosanthes scabra TaxID=79078 RepID=A0ABU6UNQ3_9FABA|nr:hypothetical protein [Stylosanthes scabra]
MTFLEFVCLPYRTDAVEAVVHPSILQADHRALWTSIVPLIYFGTIEWHQVDRLILQFGGVQNAPHQPLNIDFMHAKDGRGSDQWWPQKYQCWHGLWASRFAQLFEVAQAEDPGPSVDFLRWWFLAGKRYLVPAGLFHQLPADNIQVDATKRLSAPHPHRSIVLDVPDNRRPDRRMMVGTRTTARDWQWLDEMMADDVQAAPPTQRIRRMAEGRGQRRGGRGGRGHGEGGDTAPTQ